MFKCFFCNPDLIPTPEEMNNQMLFCGGEPICICGPAENICPNCGGINFPCPCGGDNELPNDETMEEYHRMLLDTGLVVLS